MFTTRRHFVVSGSLALSTAVAHQQQHDEAMHQEAMKVSPPSVRILDPATLAPFVDPLFIPPTAQSIGTRPDPRQAGAHLPYYRIPIQQIESRVHRDLPATRFWAYGRSMPGPTFDVRSGEAILVDWPNGLPREHFLPIDHTLMGAERGLPDARTIVHVHGAKVPPESDGYPENWYTPGASALIRYPNLQSAASLWYHDHAMGITRLNTYAGMVGLYIIRDADEDELPLPRGPYEIPLVLSDRMFTQAGQLYYPRSESPESPWVPEFYGNVTLVNGTIQPYFDVEPRLYRFRILNASNSRFYYLSLDPADAFHQIGSDQGLLSAPVALQNLSIGPGERADVLLDFTPHAGQNVVLVNGSLKLLQFRVGAQRSAVPVTPLPKTLRPVERMPEASAIKTRYLSIEEFNKPMIHLLNGARWHDPVTETPVLDSTEIWCFVNLADEPHPIHLHLVRFQVLDRHPFDTWDFKRSRNLRLLGHPVVPAPSEMGWKDTVRCEAKMVTRIIVRFDGYVGRYVWHCHILEHEDNEMMRPFDVIAPA